MMIRLKDGNAFWSRHLDGDVGVWMTAIKLRRKGLPKIQLYLMLKLATSNVSISLCLFSPVPQDTSRSVRPMGDGRLP
jgi:hypothetical protein